MWFGVAGIGCGVELQYCAVHVTTSIYGPITRSFTVSSNVEEMVLEGLEVVLRTFLTSNSLNMVSGATAGMLSVW